MKENKLKQKSNLYNTIILLFAIATAILLPSGIKWLAVPAGLLLYISLIISDGAIWKGTRSTIFTKAKGKWIEWEKEPMKYLGAVALLLVVAIGTTTQIQEMHQEMQEAQEPETVMLFVSCSTNQGYNYESKCWSECSKLNMQPDFEYEVNTSNCENAPSTEMYHCNCFRK